MATRLTWHAEQPVKKLIVNLRLSCCLFLVLCRPMSASKKIDRIYFREDETTVLKSLLQEWSDKRDTKSRDAFVSGTAVPKIQALNVKDYGPEVISTSKVAKVQ